MLKTSSALSWLSEAVLYQIYPQTFADANGDGVGDLVGITERLDYLQWLGVTAVWLSPCFASEFGDAGYDVTDYFRIAPRYGTNEDLDTLIDAARRRGIRILLDLVPGHTSHRHPWFRESANTPGDDRYIWSQEVPSPMREWVPNLGARGGFYRANFYPIQPALNFGYARPNPAEPWRQPVDAEGPRANRAALRDIMRFWFDRGVSGFRVDMAYSLVKDDPDATQTSRLWAEMREWIDRHYPHCALLAEWGRPQVAIPAGFHSDFFLHFEGAALRSLWDNNAGSIGPWSDGRACYFDPEGLGTVREFLDAWQEAEAAGRGRGITALPTANHDFSRLTCGPRTREMVAAAFALQLTWPSLPVIYYGDEIGMRYVPGLPDKEGSQLDTQARQGSRTPMQWDDGPNAGFSSGRAEDLYLPIDPDPHRPTVASDMADDASLLHQVRNLITLRRHQSALGAHAPVHVLHRDYPFVYTRGTDHLVVINGAEKPAMAPLPEIRTVRPLAVNGVEVIDGQTRAQGFSYGIFEISTAPR
ncbi:alpha-amylase family glycosyl hydrolase [Actinoplanes sp. CA-030573]|uniref:alpha-amylase family glycosyl hydrolase n=1 Tax=Actinoplanes sp. CA-030573 TaxID=3239898 RepID=UPI003D8F1B57